MAWIDDRLWCHPKFTDISDRAAWVWVKSVAYSAGFQTHGLLTAGQQKAIGTDARARRELVSAGLWHEADGCISIHDWADHNGKRDDHRARDRERKRRQRERERATDGHAEVTRTSHVTPNGKSTVTAQVDRVKE